MAGRIKTYTVRCTGEGCREYGVIEYERKTDKRVTDWRCFRHRNPEQLLTPDSPERVVTVVVEAREDINGKHFFDGRHGIITGPGFKATAEDWPVGTVFTITVKAAI